MMGFFTGLAYWGKSLVKGIAWPAKRLRGEHKLGPTMRWTLHLVALAGVLVLLGFINHWAGLERLLRTPWPVLRIVWLPLLFFSFYVAGWFAWWLVRLLRTGSQASEWPDIDAAWARATEAVEHAGIDLRSVPVYLLLGRPAGNLRSLFAAADVPLSVPQVPRELDSPLHIFANREAVYVACSDTSLLGKQASLLAQRIATQDQAIEPRHGEDVEEHELPLWNNDPSEPADENGPRGSVESLQSAVAMLVEEEPIRKADAAVATPQPRPSLLEQADVIERTTSRLQHLCTLIARDRQPYCPINGLLVLVPFAASDDELTAGQTAVLLERDLNTVRQTLEVRCGVITLICDLQDTPGGQELLARFPESQRRRRLGLSFPLLAQCDSEQTPEMIQTGVDWTCNALVPPIVYRLAKVRGGQNAGQLDQLQVNTQLYHLVAELRTRNSRFVRMLQRAFCPDGTSPWMFTGCYLAATGEDAVRGQGFAGGIFPQLVQIQNHVAWTREAIDDDHFCNRLAWAGYAALITSIIGTIVALVMISV